ncbi:hypothetical protein M4I44_09825 [Flavobacterium sp. B183]|nr:hypothetical protein [Flavobacterium sp. B183]URC14666.1 hypothetical protein M4I44_09825 [Flavobacterium sp. B183]
MDAIIFPPVKASYQIIPVPEAAKSANVALLAAQNCCVAAPVGVLGSLMLTVTAKRFVLSHVPVFAAA